MDVLGRIRAARIRVTARLRLSARIRSTTRPARPKAFFVLISVLILPVAAEALLEAVRRFARTR